MKQYEQQQLSWLQFANPNTLYPFLPLSGNILDYTAE